MTVTTDDRLIRAAFASARALEPTEAEIAAVLARAGASVAESAPRIGIRRPVGWRRIAAPALAALLLGASGYAAVPPLRAAIEDVATTFADYVARGNQQPPGRALRPGESAAHGFRPDSDPRVIAEAGGYQLQFVRTGGGSIEFDLGETGVGLGYAVEDLAGHAVYVLGPGSMANADEDGHVPLFGITAPQVTTVELTFAAGPPRRVRGVDGGFVLLADPTRAPQEVVGYDAAGDEIERIDVGYIGWDAYGPPSPRVPIECQPGGAGRNPPPHCPNA